MRPIGPGLIALAVLLSGCGRRAERAFFDAATEPLPSPAAVTPALSPTSLRVAWGEVETPQEVPPSGSIPLTVTVTNEGDVTWPDNLAASPDQPDGRYAVRMGYSWRPLEGDSPQRAKERANLPHPVAPGQVVVVPIVVRAPPEPGHFELRLELLQELYFWFADHGAAVLTLPVEVRAGATATPPPQPSG